MGLRCHHKNNGLLQGSLIWKSTTQGYPSVNHSINFWDGRGVDTFAVSGIMGFVTHLLELCTNVEIDTVGLSKVTRDESF